MQAFTAAADFLGGKYLKECILYVTLEPCHMCAKALIDARVSKLIFSTFEPKSGAITSIDNLYEKPFNHNIEYQYGLLQAESSKILKEFFKARRN
jgi:tRNA(adenine34) deaminase